LHSIKNKKILVLGGTGFLGKILIKLLLEADGKVLLISRSITRLEEFHESIISQRLKIINGNVLDKKFLETMVNKVDCIINLCGVLYESKNRDFDRVHSDLPFILGELSSKNKIQSLIHISALGVSKTSESSYSRSKASGEKRLLEIFPKGKIVRPSLLFGKGDNFFGQFSKMASLLPFLPLISGKTSFQPVFVNDVAKAIICLLTEKNNKNNIYELGGNSKYTFEQLLKILLKIKQIQRFLIPLSPKLMMIPAFFLQCLPKPPFTVDQMKLLKKDNVLVGKLPGLKELGIKVTDMKEELIKIYSK